MTTTTKNRHLTDAQIAEFWENGFIVIKDVLDADTLATAKQAILDMVPRDLVFGEHLASHSGRLKPYNADGKQSFYTPEGRCCMNS